MFVARSKSFFEGSVARVNSDPIRGLEVGTQCCLHSVGGAPRDCPAATGGSS
jgi:hypothetical protein